MSKDSVAFDSILDLCQNRHRRIVLATLATERQSSTLDDLTRTVLRDARHTPISEAPEDVKTDIRLSLHHVHLPKLASNGLVTYDPDRRLVEPTDRLDRVEPTVSAILEAGPAPDVPIELDC